jgi:phosphoglycerate dehydrogenase-like enzyme
MNVEPVGLNGLFARSQVVFILAATTTENQGTIGASYFASMRKGSVVVLISRAGVVDFDALLDAAASNHIRAAIDVFPEEPIPAHHRARQTPNTVLSAHRAGNIPEIWAGMGQMVVDDLELVLRGLPPQRCQHAVLETVTRLRSKPVS